MAEDSVAADQLRAFIERIERMEQEKAAIAADIREIYAEAKGNGFSTPVIREIVKIRKKDHDERMEFEAILDLYLSALGMQSAPPDDDPPPRRAPTGNGRAGASSATAQGFRNLVAQHGGSVTMSEGDVTVDMTTGEIIEPQPETAVQSQLVVGPLSITADEPGLTSFAGTEGDEGQHPIQPETANELPPPSRGIGGEDDLREPAATERGQIAQEGDAPLEVSANEPDEGMSEHAAHLSTDTENPTRTPAGVVVTNRNGVTGGESAASNSHPASTSPQNSLVEEGSGDGTAAAPLDSSADEASEPAPSLEGEAADQANAGGEDVGASENGRTDFTETLNSEVKPGEALGFAPASPNIARAPGAEWIEKCPTAPVRWHDFLRCFPEHWGPALADLADDIRANGVRRPIVKIGDEILDGRSRYNAARQLGIAYPVEEYDGADPLADVIRWNIESRNLTLSERKSIAAKLSKLPSVAHRASEIAVLFGLEVEDAA